jgi:hypothetical protein
VTSVLNVDDRISIFTGDAAEVSLTPAMDQLVTSTVVELVPQELIKVDQPDVEFVGEAGRKDEGSLSVSDW